MTGYERIMTRCTTVTIWTLISGRCVELVRCFGTSRAFSQRSPNESHVLVARSLVCQRNFAELKKQYESYSDLGQLTASILQDSSASQVDETNVSGLPSRGYHSDGDIAAGARGTGMAHGGTIPQTRAGLVPATGLRPR